jgi:hypothetical protein
MHVFTALFGFLTPILVSAWIGSRVSQPWGAFFLGWISTPIVAFVTALVLIGFINTPTANLVAIELPIAGLGFGLLSGGIAAFIAYRRGKAGVVGGNDLPPPDNG